MEKNLRHFALFVYSLREFSQKQKVKIIRELFGYKEKKGIKLYEHKGLLQKTNAVKIASNVILVPVEELVLFQNYFNSNRIKVELKEVWLKK